VANIHRLRWIAEVEYLGHAPNPPAGGAGYEVSDASVAFPPALVRVAQSFDDLGHQRALGRIGHIPNFMRLAAEDAQHVGLARSALRQRLAIADAYHLRPALLVVPWQTGNVRKVFRLCRIGHVDDRRAVILSLPGQPVDRLRHVGRSAMVTDIGDVAAALVMD